MFSTKPAASLSSGLLARKGQARPAMRPHGFVGMTPEGLEDLGWNDMGDRTPIDQVAGPAQVPAEMPSVLRQRERLGQEFADADASRAVDAFAEPKQAAVAPVETVCDNVVDESKCNVSVNTAARLQRETSRKKGKAAFTLRLDQDRHLRLRLASAIRNRSAQTIVTEALDAFLQTLPEIETLVRQVDAGQRR